MRLKIYSIAEPVYPARQRITRERSKTAAVSNVIVPCDVGHTAEQLDLSLLN